jgi:hypothetical protein
MEGQRRTTRKSVAGTVAVVRYFGPARRQALTAEIGGETFQVIVHYSPSDRLGEKNKAEIHSFFNRNRLGITTKLIDEHLSSKNWDAVLFAKNMAKDDAAVCTLQWAPWCPDTGQHKLWIHDISRIGTVKGATSPVKVLTDYCKAIGEHRGLTHVYLLVDEKDKKVMPSEWKVLTGIYSRTDYGFGTNAEECVIGETAYTAMKAPV